MYRHCPVIVVVTGFVILVIGIVCSWYGFPKLVQWQINQNIEMVEGTQAFDFWKKQPFPLHFKVYFFNVSNAGDVMLGSPPVLKQIGPYVYDLHIEREIIDIDENEDTITYNLIKKYHFNETLSGCRNDEEIVTVINAPLMATLLKVGALLPTFIQTVAEAFPFIYPNNTDVFLRIKVKDILFDGVTVYCSAPEIEMLCQAMRLMPPKQMVPAPNGLDFIFSLFGIYNNSRMGPITMSRGIKSATRGQLILYDDEPTLGIWRSGDTPCNMLNGSDSGLYVPMKKPDDQIYTFTPEICRSVAIYLEKKVEIDDITAYKYSSTEETFSHDGPNQCFCRKSNDEYECPAPGLLDLEPCIDAPILMSHPHFYLSDKKLLEFADGLQPNKNLHESYVILEPATATPLEGAKRTQMNVEIRKFSDFPLTINLTEGIFPIIWLEETVVLPDHLKSVLRESFGKIFILDILKWILIVGGTITMILAFALVIYKERLICFTNIENENIPRSRFPDTFTPIHINHNSSVVYPHSGIPTGISNPALVWNSKM